MYLCGYEIDELVQKGVPGKLLEQTGVNFCFEFAVVSMLQLKDNDSSCLVYGSLHGGREFPSAWTEYRNLDGKRMVRNYSSEPTNATFAFYRDDLRADTQQIFLHYIFWDSFARRLYNLMQFPETSFVLKELSFYRPIHIVGKIIDTYSSPNELGKVYEFSTRKFLPYKIDDVTISQEVFDSAI